ncbi:MAG TPA: trypsin-like peptidase domain-containing protein, partial [Chloroflexota bacterium]|nr:trypsin-like peptidase domain-containing protein [Chloroflexota bacterium]
MHNNLINIPKLVVLSILLLLTAACGASGEAQTDANLETAESGVVSALEDVQSAVVQIVATGSFKDPEQGTQMNAAGSGSGFIIDPSGIAITNNHVVTGASFLKVFIQGEEEPRNAKIVAVSECSDVAVIDIDGDNFPY